MAKRLFSIQEKQEYCVALEKSGLPASQFCKTIGVSSSALRKWRIEFSKGESRGGFSPLVVTGSQGFQSEADKIQIAIHLPSQTQICIQLNEDRLVSLIQELSHATAIIR